MVKQRIYAIESCKTEYVLLLDDDVEFDSNLVEQLYARMIETGATVGEVCLVGGRQSRIRKIINKICLVAGTHDNQLYHRIINRAGGHCTRHVANGEVCFEQSGHGTHCFARTDVLKKMHFEEELWLEDSSYALPDDQVFYYKLWLQGNKIVYCSDVYLRHLDAKTTGNKNRHNSLLYAKGRNYLIFWHKQGNFRARTTTLAASLFR